MSSGCACSARCGSGKLCRLGPLQARPGDIHEEEQGMLGGLRAVVFGVASAMVLAGAGVAFAQASGEQAVKERSDLMKSFNEANKTVAAAAKGGEIDANVVKAAEHIADGAKKITSLFPAGTGDDKLRTRAKPAIWQNWATFEGDAKNLENSFAAVAVAAKAGDKAGVAATFAKANQACSACHKEFRGPALK
jgi:cytochrome c556